MLFILYLAVLSVCDIRTRDLPLWLVGMGTLPGALVVVLDVLLNGRTWEDILFGFVPGAVLLCLAWLKKGTGLGDGIVLLQMNLFLHMEESVVTFIISILGIGLFSVGVLLFRKGGKETRIPYLPFLLGGCICSLLFF